MTRSVGDYEEPSIGYYRGKRGSLEGFHEEVALPLVVCANGLVVVTEAVVWGVGLLDNRGERPLSGRADAILNPLVGEDDGFYQILVAERPAYFPTGG